MDNIRLKLRTISEYFREVRYAAVLNKNGDVIATVDSIDAFPPEFEAFVMSFLELSQSFMKIFTSNSSLKTTKLRGLNHTIFYVYLINDDFLLVFYSLAGVGNKSFVTDFDGPDKCIESILDELNDLLRP